MWSSAVEDAAEQPTHRAVRCDHVQGRHRELQNNPGKSMEIIYNITFWSCARCKPFFDHWILLVVHLPRIEERSCDDGVGPTTTTTVISRLLLYSCYCCCCHYSYYCTEGTIASHPTLLFLSPPTNDASRFTIILDTNAAITLRALSDIWRNTWHCRA